METIEYNGFTCSFITPTPGEAFIGTVNIQGSESITARTFQGLVDAFHLVVDRFLEKSEYEECN